MKKKNLILITIDSFRADRIGSLGYGKKITQNLDAIAKKGVLFTEAFSYGSSTFTSIPPMLTSSPIIPYYSGIFKRQINITCLRNFLDIYKEIIEKLFILRPTIAGILQQHGYETAAFHSNPYLSRFYGYGKDYSHFDDSFDGHGFIKKVEEKIKILLVSKKLDNFAKRLYFLLHQDDTPYVRAEIINKKAISWIKEKKPENFFLWLHYMDTHVPYIPPKEFRKKITRMKMSDLNRKLLSNEDISEEELNQIKDLYDGSINYIDSSIKSLLDNLNDLKILNDTIIIITADHGEEFKEHGGLMHTEARLYDEFLHVPLIIYGTEYADVIVSEPVSLIDIVPTIIDLLNIDIIHNFDGKSLIPIIKGDINNGIISQGMGVKGIDSNWATDKQSKSELIESNGLDSNLRLILAYRTKQWKYILDNIRNREELYNVLDDPKETLNLIDTNKNIAKEYKKVILDCVLHQNKSLFSDLKKEKIKKDIMKLRKKGKI